MNGSLHLATALFRLDGGRYSISRNKDGEFKGFNVHFKGKRYRGSCLSRILYRLGY